MEKRIYIVLLTGLMLLSCSPRALHEAQGVVAQADSLRAEGRMYDDSLALAQAYGTLGHWQWFYADEYAHACYHYGRLLREKDNPAAAMECFISATHAPTRDYYILGRVYNNIGEISYLANEYQLSYDMYSKAAELFLNNGDSLYFCYSLYKMAFEKAVLGEKDRVYEILNLIECANIADSLLTSCCLITKAQKCMCCQEYDSAVYYAHQALRYNSRENMPRIQLTQAYDNIGQQDSALIYANMVLNSPDATYQNKFNALYVVLHNDSNLTAEDINSLASYREDIRYYKYEPEKEKLIQAVQLCEQDIARKPDWRWLYAIIVTLFVVGISLFIYVHPKHKKQELLAQKLDMLQQATATMQERHDELETNYMNNHQHILEEIEYKCSVLRNGDKIYTTLAWKNYHKMCSAVDKQFYLLASKLRSKQCLNETGIRLCVLTLLDCGYEQMAELLFRSTTSIGTLKIRVAKKLGTSSKNLRQYLIDNECLK